MSALLMWVETLTVSPPASMAQRQHRHHPSIPLAQDFETPPPSEAEKTDDVDHNIQAAIEDEDVPPEYRDREFNWFVPGRLFKIFAPRDVEIHKKEFVLLDTKNKEGPGLLICAHHGEQGEINRGYFLRSHVAVQNYVSPQERDTRSRTKTVYLDAYEDRDVEYGTWIELEHSYNIPFAKYKCVDRGVLDRASLQDLRRSYVEWLQYHWSLG